MKARSKFSDRVAVIAMSDEGKTQQHYGPAVNINNILAKYRKTGIIEHVNRAQERYGDFLAVADYAKDLDKVAKAQQMFEMLPAELRNHFKNSIPGFFEYIQKPENKEQCIKWGIFKAPPAPPEEPATPPANTQPAPKKQSKTTAGEES